MSLVPVLADVWRFSKYVLFFFFCFITLYRYPNQKTPSEARAPSKLVCHRMSYPPSAYNFEHNTLPGCDIFSVPLFRLRIFLLIFIFHFENLSKFIIFSNEDVRRIEPQTNNH